MSGIEETRGDLVGAGRRFGIVAARFNRRIGDALIAGAVDCLRRHGVAPGDIELVTVPGAWEIAQALDALAAAGTAGAPRADGGGGAAGRAGGPVGFSASAIDEAAPDAAARSAKPQPPPRQAPPPAGGARLDALIALGVVIRGETPHFDYLSRECTAGIARAGERHRLPVAYGVLTCDTTEQAEERAGGKAGNKGWEAALAALEMADLFARLRAAG